jgi:hypothetical protein
MKAKNVLESRAALPVAWVGGAAVTWVGNAFGLWWVTVVVGVAIGLLLRGTGRVLVAAGGDALAGWGLHLLWLARLADLGGTATVVAEIMGLGHSDKLVTVLALVFGLLLGLGGAWLGAAARRAVAAFGASAPAVATEPAARAGDGKRGGGATSVS